SLGLSHSAAEKLARLLLEWSCKNGESSKAEPRLKLRLTHEEIAQMIGTSRETVTRLFADMKKHQIVQSKGSTLVIRNSAALREIPGHNQPGLPQPPRPGSLVRARPALANPISFRP